MRIAINALFRFRPSGVANYICNLVYHLSKVDKENQYLVLANKASEAYFPIKQDNFKLVFCKESSSGAAARRIWEQFVLPRYIRSGKIDILHCPMNVLPVWPGCPTVVTIIDTQYFQNPRDFSFLRRNYLKFMMRLSLRRADGVITISKAVKDELSQCLAHANSKEVKVVHFGVDACFHVIPDAELIAQVKQKYGIKGRYVLFPGYPHYRKNIPRLIVAFKKASATIGEQHTLVIAGEMGADESDMQNIRQTINDHGLSDRVLFTGYVGGICLQDKTQADMALLMNGAALLAYPSLYEGFGLPVLEAMACGTPVLTSNIPVMHEVAGSAALLVNPYEVDDIAAGIRRCLTDESLRQELIASGLDRAKQFSWDKLARETIACYESILGK